MVPQLNLKKFLKQKDEMKLKQKKDFEYLYQGKRYENMKDLCKGIGTKKYKFESKMLQRFIEYKIVTKVKLIDSAQKGIKIQRENENTKN